MVVYTEEKYEAAKVISSAVAAIDRYVVDPTDENHEAVLAKVDTLPDAIEQYSQAVEEAEKE